MSNRAANRRDIRELKKLHRLCSSTAKGKFNPFTLMSKSNISAAAMLSSLVWNAGKQARKAAYEKALELEDFFLEKGIAFKPVG